MHSSDHHAGNRLHSSKGGIALALLAKLTLAAGLLMLAKLGIGNIRG